MKCTQFFNEIDADQLANRNYALQVEITSKETETEHFKFSPLSLDPTWFIFPVPAPLFILRCPAYEPSLV